MSLHAILGILDKLSLGFLFSLPTLLLYLRIETGNSKESRSRKGCRKISSFTRTEKRIIGKKYYSI